MRHLLAGGGGFVGSHLAELFLARGDEVVVVDNFATGRRSNIAHLADHERFSLIEHDITTPPARLRHGQFDAVLDLASPASPTDFATMPLEILAVGSTGTRNLLDLAVANGARFFLASTSEVYGDPLVHPQPESYWGNVSSIGPRSCYDEAKRFSEAITMAYHRVHGVDVRIVRIFNTYGERMRPDDGRVVNTFIVQALRGEPITLHGDGTQTRSFCHVADEIVGLTAVLDGHLTGPVNVGNPGEFTIRELAELVVELTGFVERDHHRAAAARARGRPAAAPARHHPDQSTYGWQPADRVARGPGPHDRLVPPSQREEIAMSVLVTGGAGYIGSHTVRRLTAARSRGGRARLDGVRAPQRRHRSRARRRRHRRSATSSSSCAPSATSTQVVHFAAYKNVGESMAQPVALLAQQRRRAP